MATPDLHTPPPPGTTTDVPCATNPDNWCANTTTELAHREAAIRICNTCPVAALCLELALQVEAGQPLHGRHGIWAGTTPRQRHALATKEDAPC